MAYLTDEEILALKTSIVRDNQKITHLRFESGTYGIGNTNTSPYRGSGSNSPIHLYDGKTLYSRGGNCRGVVVAAIVEDVVYLIRYSYGSERVIRLHLNESDTETRGVAYDTYQDDSITPISIPRNEGEAL